MAKAIKSLVSVCLMLCCALSVKGYDLVVTVNNPDLVNVLINYSEQTLTGNTTTISNLSGYNYVMVTTNDAVIQKVVRNGVSEENPMFVDMNMNDDYGIETFTLDITAISNDDIPKKSFTAVIDNPSRVELSLEPKGKYLSDLKAGENTIEYIPETMTYLSVTAPWGEAPIYKVTTSGGTTPKQYNDGSWEVDIEENAVITITTDYPDETVPVTFDFNNDGLDCISAIEVNGIKIEEFNPDNFEVKLGSKLSITLNKQDYVLKTFKYNDYEPYMEYSDSYSAYVTGPVSVTLDAIKNKMVNFTVDVNIGEGVSLYRGEYIGSGYPVTLVDGKNDVEVNAAAPAISFAAADGYEIEEVTLNGINVEYDSFGGKYTVTISEGDILSIKVNKIVRDQKIALYLTDKDMWSNFNLTIGNSTVVDLKNGYNILEYAADELSSVGLYANSWYYDTSNAQLYVNDVLQTPEYVGTFQFALSLQGGDVVKVFFNGAPARYNVVFDVEDGIELSDVLHDYVASFDPAQGLECFLGTEISFAADNYVVKLKGTDLIPDENNVYTFFVDEDLVVEVKKKDPSSVLETIDDNTHNVIYNINGLRIPTQDNLPAGIYIIDGKKTVIR